jgi:hypothetical protein
VLEGYCCPAQYTYLCAQMMSPVHSPIPYLHTHCCWYPCMLPDVPVLVHAPLPATRQQPFTLSSAACARHETTAIMCCRVFPACSTIYNMCTQKPPYDYSEQLYQRYKDAFNNYINDMVGPVVKNVLWVGFAGILHMLVPVHVRPAAVHTVPVGRPTTTSMTRWVLFRLGLRLGLKQAAHTYVHMFTWRMHVAGVQYCSYGVSSCWPAAVHTVHDGPG